LRQGLRSESTNYLIFDQARLCPDPPRATDPLSQSSLPLEHLFLQAQAAGKSVTGTEKLRGLLVEELEGLAVEVGKFLQLNGIDTALACLDLGDVLLARTQRRRRLLLTQARCQTSLSESQEELAVALRVPCRHRAWVYPPLLV
jgi:hypothetical protein